MAHLKKYDMTTPSLEIDFFNVDSGEKSGDAITLRYGDFIDKQNQFVVVIDGGTIETGQKMIKHIRDVYGTNYVDLVVCSHPDGDHASGLREIVRDMRVNELWMHQPWEHSDDIKHLFKDGRMTENSLSQKLKDAYGFAYDLEEIAKAKKNIKITEPFTGLSFDNFTIEVLGPSEDYYLKLVPFFTKTPEVKTSLFSQMSTGLNESINWIKETLDIETLDESGETSGENNSSTVLLLKFQEGNYLFTGDTGIPALKNVIAYSKSKGINLKNLRFLQVPHHGSRRNSSPSVLNEIKAKTAYISAAKDSEKHPSRKVINALIRRGAKVYSTEGSNLCHYLNCDSREGYSSATAHQFYEIVQD
jgi:beta-lactamase superfamily II metal-dependent hydrolase